MNDQFDVLAKSMAQSVTRRGTLKKFGLGLAGIALASLGLANKAEAGTCKDAGKRRHGNDECCSHICVHDNTGSVPYNKSGLLRVSHVRLLHHRNRP